MSSRRLDPPARGRPPHPDRFAGAGVGRARGVLSHAPFRRLYSALVLSSFGDWLGFLATTALAAQLVEGFSAQAFATGGVLVFRLLPAVLLGPLAGAFADRWDRRRTMVACDLVRFALFVSIPLSESLVYLLLASFLIEAVSLFWIPAKEASVPNLVPRERLEAANQLTLIATYGSAPVAAAVFAGLGVLSRLLGNPFEFFSTRPVDLALYVNAATFLFAAATVYRMKGEIPSPRVAPREPGEPAPSVLTSLREGLAFARQDPLVRGLLVGMLGALAAGGAIIAQGQLFAQTVVGGGQAAYGLLFGAVFLGIAGGVGFGPRLLGDLSRKRAFGPSIVGAGSALLCMALVPNLFLAVVATLLVGFFAGVAYVVGITLLGAEVPDERRGRTFGLVQSLMRIDLLLVTGLTPFVSGAIGRRDLPLPGGGVYTLNGVTVTLFVGGLLGVLVGVVSFRQMDDRPGVPLRQDLLGLLRTGPASPSLPGTFLAFEGGEGAGKSTQLGLLVDWLRAGGHDVVVTREPGATPLGARLRALLLEGEPVSPRAEALLYAADRAHHVATVVRPALERGAVVVTDRYVDSSLAYQGAGRALSSDEVARLSRWSTEGLRPDLVLLLDVDPAVGLARARRTGAPDRIEAESLAFHARVRQAFLDLAARDPDRYLVVAADAPADAVQARLRERVAALLP
ncbi:MAG: dTMP kinase, partial [Actinomycetota bacterium]|nr:dTMP kinase [Actinomycetota bacterium]